MSLAISRSVGPAEGTVLQTRQGKSASWLEVETDADAVEVTLEVEMDADAAAACKSCLASIPAIVEAPTPVNVSPV